MWSWKYRRPPLVRPWRTNSTFLTTSHLHENVELHILVRVSLAEGQGFEPYQDCPGSPRYRC
jgi:hypothetical protein